MIFNIFSHSCVIIDVLIDVWVEVFVINVWALPGVYVGIIIDVLSEMDVEVLTGVNINVLVPATTAL